MVEIERAYPLARLTTVRAGGAAERFARAATREELLELLAAAAHEGLELNVVGSGSNLLVADEGVGGLVIRLEGALARIEPLPSGLECGGGARMPIAAARAAAIGLRGIEFAVNIPGTVGGSVRMNANAYDGALADVLEWVEIATAEGVARRAPAELGLAYRSSALRPGEVVAAARFALARSTPEAVKATLAAMRERRHAAQPKGIKTFGSTFKNPPGATAGELLAAAGAAGLQVGGARLSRKHANFVENTGAATTADIVELMALARRRVLEHAGIALEREVQALGPVRFPWEEDAAAR
ncbi:MAG TPA: UDP-N-acetylmuramate dehydrogenase [Solirubrobacteraceae bacterium]|nr:UDP-N-acetylmuramate dehydrogenase [Solirubrobacteraceae bacterium]